MIKSDELALNGIAMRISICWRVFVVCENNRNLFLKKDYR